MSGSSARDNWRPYNWYHTIWDDTTYHKVGVFDMTSVMTSMFTASVYEFTKYMYDHDVW